MKTLENISEPNSRIHEATPNKTRAVSFIKSILVIFMLSGLFGLSSCAIALRTPQPQRHGVVIMHQYRSERPVYRKHYYKKEHHDHGKHRGHGDHDD